MIEMPKFSKKKSAAAQAPAPAPVEEQAPAPDPVVAAAPVAAPAPVSTGKYRVTKGGLVGMNGSLTTISVGAEIDESGYGKAGIDRLREAGIQLEPIG